MQSLTCLSGLSLIHCAVSFVFMQDTKAEFLANIQMHYTKRVSTLQVDCLNEFIVDYVHVLSHIYYDVSTVILRNVHY